MAKQPVRRLTSAELEIFVKALILTQSTGWEINPKKWPEPALSRAKDIVEKSAGFSRRFVAVSRFHAAIK